MKAKSIKGKSAAEIQVALSNCISDGYQPTLAILFVSIIQDRQEISRVLDDAGIAIFGTTTNGEFIDQDLGTESIAILLLDLNPAYFQVIFEEFPELNYREVAKGIAKKSREKFETPAFLISASNMQTDAEELLRGFEDICGPEVNVCGGMAGDDFQFSEQFVFTNNKESNRGMVVVALDENRVTIKGRAIHGWKAVGTPKTITKSEGNHIYTVDDIPVLDLTIKYGGLTNLSKVPKETAVEIATTLPLQLQREKGSPVMRPGLIVDWDDGSFYCAGSVPQGAKVRFSLPPDFDVMETVIRGAEEFKLKEMPEGDALIVFSCAGRIIALGPMMTIEIEGLYKTWNVPMVGMFSNAELARATEGNLEMHGLTTCWVVLKESL